MVVFRTVLLGAICSLLLGAASLPFAQASPEKTGGREGSSTDKELEDLTSAITTVLLESAMSKDSPAKLESLTSTMMLLMLESCWSKGNLRDSLAAQNESDHSAPREETVAPPSSSFKRATPADVELINSVWKVLRAYASKYNFGKEIKIGPQPTRDLTVSTSELFNSLSVMMLTYAQTHEGWGNCTEDATCFLIF